MRLESILERLERYLEDTLTKKEEAFLLEVFNQLQACRWQLDTMMMVLTDRIEELAEENERLRLELRR